MKVSNGVYAIDLEKSKVNIELLKKLINEGKIQSVSQFDCDPEVDFDRYPDKPQVARLILKWSLVAAGIINYIIETRYDVDYSQLDDDKDEVEINKTIIRGMLGFVLEFNDRYPGVDLKNAIPELNKARIAEIRDYILNTLRKRA